MSDNPGVQLLTSPSPSGTGRFSARDGAAGANQFRSDFAAQLQSGAQGAVAAETASARVRPTGATGTGPAAPSQVVPASRVPPSEEVRVSLVRPVASLVTAVMGDHPPVATQLVNRPWSEGAIASGGSSLPRPGKSLPSAVDVTGNAPLVGNLPSELSSNGFDLTAVILLADPLSAQYEQPIAAPEAGVSLFTDTTALDQGEGAVESNPGIAAAPAEGANLAQGELTPGLERVVPALFKGAFDHSPHAAGIREHLQTVPGGKLTSVPLPDVTATNILKSQGPTAVLTQDSLAAEIPVVSVDTKFDLGAKVGGELGLAANASSVGHTTVTNPPVSLTSVPASPAAAGALSPFSLQLGDATPGNNIPALALHTPAGTPGWTGELGNQIRWLLERGGQVAELRLNPAELGSVDVKLSRDGDSTNVVFYTANSHARELLEAALPRLRDMFAAQGMNLGEANVSEHSLAQHHASQHAQSQDGDGSRRRGAQGVADGISDASVNVSSVNLTQGLIDYYV